MIAHTEITDANARPMWKRVLKSLLNMVLVSLATGLVVGPLALSNPTWIADHILGVHGFLNGLATLIVAAAVTILSGPFVVGLAKFIRSGNPMPSDMG